MKRRKQSRQTPPDILAAFFEKDGNAERCYQHHLPRAISRSSLRQNAAT
ncbi:hypothetical protein [Conchiformibius steedae]|nr:hypothetical protein [Conchiformibius steedae]